MASGTPAQPTGSEQTRALRALQASTAHAEIALGKRLGLGPRELSALSHMAFAAGTLTPSELAERLDLSASAATELVDRLEKLGHISRQRDVADRRRVRLHTSDAAVTEVRAALAPLLADLNEVAASFTPDERAVIDRYLQHAAAAHDRFAASPLIGH